MKKLLTAAVGTLCLLAWGSAVPAQSPTLYTIADVYYYLVDGTEATEGGHSLEPPSGATPGDTRFKTLEELYEDVKAIFDQCDALPGDVSESKTFFSFQTSSWGVRTGSASSSKLLVTGLTTSYADYDDGWYEKGLAYDYTSNGDGTFTDNVIGLMWAQSSNDEGCYDGSTVHWTTAIDWADDLTFAGYSDWRLPNNRELNSIVFFKLGWKYEAPMNSRNGMYWTSTSSPYDTGRAMVWHFTAGNNSRVGKGAGPIYARAVRDAD